LFLILKKRFTYLFYSIFLILLIILLINFITGYNNFDLLNRSPSTVASYFEIKNYFLILIRYFAKNPYLIVLIYLVINHILKNVNDKKLFFLLALIFLFLQSSIISVLHGAGINHMMSFLFLSLCGIYFINQKNSTIFVLTISFFLIISSALNYIQILNYNKIGRQGLYFNQAEKNQILNFQNHLKNKYTKPILVLGAGNRTEIFLLEEINGVDTQQLASYLDPNWKQFLFRSKKEINNYEKIFKNKFDNIKTVIVLENKNYLDKIEFIKKNNFEFEEELVLTIYENNARNFLNLYKILFSKGKTINFKKKKFLIFTKTTF